MKDFERMPLSDVNEGLKDINYNKKYRKIFLTSICLNIVFIIVIISLIIKLQVQKNNFENEKIQLLNEKELCEKKDKTLYYSLTDNPNHEKSETEDNNVNIDNNNDDNENKIDNNNDNGENANNDNDFNNDFINNNISEEKPVLDISKDELLEMCYKSRALYYKERRIQQNRQFPGMKYIDENSGTNQS